MHDDNIYNLLVRFFSEELTPAERRIVAAWREESQENRISFREIKRIWQASVPEEPPTLPDIESSLLEVRATLEQSDGSQHRHILPLLGRRPASSAPRIAFRSTFAIAASLVLLVGATLWYNLHQGGQVVTTANAQRTEVTLPDGSLVSVNHGSHLTYDNDFGTDGRRVHLDGEAFFQVTANALPFVVETKGATVRVHGTKFNVWNRDGETRVVVVEGLVSLRSDNHEVLLHKNQKSKTHPGETPRLPVTVDAEKYQGWLKGELYFDMETLAEVARELSRKYDVAIKISGPEIAGRTMTGSFGQQPIEVTLKSVCLALNLTYHKEKHQYVILQP